ncbi:MAG: hypothetical protein DWG76_04675 [Chloroflexi bacterium]|nr:M28 family peptidase [Chloroflexota bacterium]MQC26731.1 hypothetical protein [Chloroflexota bacterium]
MITKPHLPRNPTVILAILSLVLVALGLQWGAPSSQLTAFNGQRALLDVAYQVDLGPRIPGSLAQSNALAWMQRELESSGWTVETQRAERLGHALTNLVARRGTGDEWILLGAHYDSRLLADRDPDPEFAQLPVPGANDGASGVAVLLELARVLPETLEKEIWLVFFDAEDSGGLPGWDWILGSRAFAEQLTSNPEAVIIVDMVGDVDLSLPIDGNSDPELVAEIWSIAAQLGYGDIFLNQTKYYILDDHIPFLERGIPAVDIIDLEYEFWHTRADTTDKVSVHSLQVVGDTLLAWLLAE